MLCARINPERDFLFVAAAAVAQLQCKGNHLHDFGLALFVFRMKLIIAVGVAQIARRAHIRFRGTPAD